MKTQILAFAIAAMFIAAPAWTHGDEHSDSHHEAVAISQASAGNEVKVLEEGYASLQKALADNSFDKIHEVVEGMEPALKSLGAAHKEDAGIAGTTEQLGKVLHTLHTAGDAKDAEAVTAELKKLGGGLQLLKARFAPHPDSEQK